MRARVAGRKADQGIETEHGFHSKTSDRYVAGRKADQGIETELILADSRLESSCRTKGLSGH